MTGTPKHHHNSNIGGGQNNNSGYATLQTDLSQLNNHDASSTLLQALPMGNQLMNQNSSQQIHQTHTKFGERIGSIGSQTSSNYNNVSAPA